MPADHVVMAVVVVEQLLYMGSTRAHVRSEFFHKQKLLFFEVFDFFKKNPMYAWLEAHECTQDNDEGVPLHFEIIV